jgi:hypothetical protein
MELLKTINIRAPGFIEKLGTTCIWSGGDTDIFPVFVMYTVTVAVTHD